MTDAEDDAYREETAARMWRLHPVERLSMLSMTIVKCNARDVMGIARGFLAMLKLMTRLQSAQTRAKVANLARDFADEIERSLHPELN